MKPRLASIRIYPVKGLAPVALPHVEIDAAGSLKHDRAWALRDESGRLITGKNFAAIHTLRWLDVDDRSRLAEDASQQLSRRIELTERIPGGFPDDADAWGPTIASRATFATVASWFAEEGMTEAGARMRFRANLEFDGVPAFWEDQLYPRRFRVGRVEFEGVNPCQRCIVPSRDALTGDPVEAFQKRFMNRREATLPDWADRSFFNHHYRLTVNTRIQPDQAGKWLHVGDEFEFIA
jgi:hypothetical protein